MSQVQRIFVTLLFLQTVATHVYAQKLKNSTEKYHWATMSLAGNGIDTRHSAADRYIAEYSDQYYLRSGEFNNYNLNITASEKIIPVRSKNGWGIVRVNTEGKIIWEFQRERGDDVVGMGMMGKNVVIITAENEKKITTARAILVDGATGEVIKQKKVFEFPGTEYFKLRIQNDENGDFKSLMAISHEKKDDPSVQIISFDEQLTTSTPVKLKPTFPLLKFAGSLVAKSGEILLADFSEEQFTIARFSKDGTELQKLSTPLERKFDRFQSVLQFNINNPESVIIGLKYSPSKKDWATRLLRFDFKSGKVLLSPLDLLDKSHADDYKLEDVKGVADGNLKWIEDAVIAGVVQWQNKIVVIKEIRTNVVKTSSTGRTDIDYSNHACILSIYDDNLQHKSTTGIKKRYNSNLPSSLTLGFHVYNNKLIILDPASTGLMSSEIIFLSLNLESEKMDPIKFISDLKRGGVSASELNATLWFKDSFLVQELKTGNGMFNPFNCVLHKIVL